MMLAQQNLFILLQISSSNLSLSGFLSILLPAVRRVAAVMVRKTSDQIAAFGCKPAPTYEVFLWTVVKMRKTCSQVSLTLTHTI